MPDLITNTTRYRPQVDPEPSLSEPSTVGYEYESEQHSPTPTPASEASIRSSSAALFTVSAIPFYVSVWAFFYICFSLPITCLGADLTHAGCGRLRLPFLCDALERIHCGGKAARIMASLFTGSMPAVFGSQ
ncbi:hypothetical protein CSOJ01_13556 [Colletotrichum sojae]|uniref:Uncharacterized protein n=1 Tax=Colletotrichum sojae TaxID=2175907 RepID=A0A8H6ISX3_9PEZI|nr:hypothetical protein CSOJ01_13556 [Colletotrichum sojae]